MGSKASRSLNSLDVSPPASPDERPVIFFEASDSFVYRPDVQSKLSKDNNGGEASVTVESSSSAQPSGSNAEKLPEKENTRKKWNVIGNLAQHSLAFSQIFHLDRKNESNDASVNKYGLTGKNELEKNLPMKEAKIFIATWNMNGQAPPKNLGSLLRPTDLSLTPDIIVFSTQESYPDENAWEFLLQTTLGITYVLYHTAQMGALRMVIFMRKELIWNVSAVDEDSHSVRVGKAFKTKGGIAVAFYLFGSSFLFVNSHLTAHEYNFKDRLEDVRKIIKNIQLPDKLSEGCEQIQDGRKNAIDCFDYVFWMGDLNFRLSASRSYVTSWVKNTSFPLKGTLPQTLEEQLAIAMSDGRIFRGFREPPITFPPTFKYDSGTNELDTSHKQRTPSYTDRILFKCNLSSSFMSASPLQSVAYNSVPTVVTSDHKPVWGLFKCRIKPGKDTLPLNAGNFKRDVYLGALKTRKQEHRECECEPCCIQ